MFLPHIIKSGKKRNHGYVDIRKWNGEGIPYSIFLRNLQHNFEVQRPTLIVKFLHTTQSLRSKATIYLFIYLFIWVKNHQKVTKLSQNGIFSSSSFWEKHRLKGTEICFLGGGCRHICVLTGYSSKSSLK
jgi:hypothetical protein